MTVPAVSRHIRVLMEGGEPAGVVRPKPIGRALPDGWTLSRS